MNYNLYKMSIKKFNLHCDFIYAPYMKFLFLCMISLDESL